MAKSAPTGSRIRQERLRKGMRQGQVASDAGISASYLNLIEHNRRRIGGKLLSRIAEALEVEAATLAEGAEATLVAGLQEAAARADLDGEDLSSAEGFASRYPVWARALVEQDQKLVALERTVQTLTDRLTHDPFLSTSLHEVISSVTAIRSSAAILADTSDIDPEWQARFLRNIRDDSHRLGDSAASLTAYLDGAEKAQDAGNSPAEQLEAVFTAHDFYLPDLEPEVDMDAAGFAQRQEALSSPAAKRFATGAFARYRENARRIPVPAFLEALRTYAEDPIAIARHFSVPLGDVLRRWAMLPNAANVRSGFLVSDAAGATLLRKSVDGFSIPRFGSLCALWPVFEALSRPQVPIRRKLVVGQGASREVFLTYAIAAPQGSAGYDEVQTHEATMLILPHSSRDDPVNQLTEVGTSCATCPHMACRARREPSILGGGVDESSF